MEPAERPIPARPAPVLLALIVLTALLGACTGQGVNAQLAEAKALWEAKGIDDYTMTVDQSCFCPFDDPVDVTVVDDRLTDVKVNGVDPDPERIRGIPMTVLELFEVVSRNAGAAKITVDWDETFGYPRRIAVDSDANAMDDEFSINVTSFLPAS